MKMYGTIDEVGYMKSLIKEVYDHGGTQNIVSGNIWVQRLIEVKGEDYFNQYVEELKQNVPEVFDPPPLPKPKKKVAGSETQASFDTNIIDDNSIKTKMEKLSKDLLYHSDLYYQHPDKVELSDYDFDMMLKELESLEQKYPQYRTDNSPTQKVGN